MQASAAWLADLPFVPEEAFPMTDNTLLRNMWDHVMVERASVGIYYRGKGEYGSILHDLKGGGRVGMARLVLAEVIQRKLIPTGFLEGVSFLVPVPTTPLRWWQRGYNPAEVTAGIISQYTGIPVLHGLLQRRRESGHQARSGRFDRLELEKGITLCPGYRDLPVGEGTHLLLVDDVATSGTTLTACALPILSAFPNARVSVFALGWSGN